MYDMGYTDNMNMGYTMSISRSGTTLKHRYKFWRMSIVNATKQIYTEYAMLRVFNTVRVCAIRMGYDRQTHRKDFGLSRNHVVEV